MIKPISNDLVCSFNPLRLPIGVLEIGELVVRMKNCLEISNNDIVVKCVDLSIVI